MVVVELNRIRRIGRRPHHETQLIGDDGRVVVGRGRAKQSVVLRDASARGVGVRLTDEVHILV